MSETTQAAGVDDMEASVNGGVPDGPREISAATREATERLVSRYAVARSALLPLLHLVQADHGHVTDEGIAFCAERLGLTRAEVGAVSTFYTMFKREPVGDWLLSVCTNPTCKVAGAQQIYERYVENLGGHRDPESGVSVEHAECLGICDAAPVVQVNYEMYGPVTDEQADELLAACKAGSPPPSNWSGEVPGTFQQVEWDLSGADDGTDEQLAAAARAEVSMDVPPANISGETDIPVTHPGGDPTGVGGAVFRESLLPVVTSPTEHTSAPTEPASNDHVSTEREMPDSVLTQEDGEPAPDNRVSTEREMPDSMLTREDDEPGEEG